MWAISESERWGPYLQVCQWGFNMGKLKYFQIPCPLVCYENRSFEGPDSICGSPPGVIVADTLSFNAKIGLRIGIVHHKSDRKLCVIPTADRNSISCGQYLDQTSSKIPPIHGPYLLRGNVKKHSYQTLGHCNDRH